MLNDIAAKFAYIINVGYVRRPRHLCFVTRIKWVTNTKLPIKKDAEECFHKRTIAKVKYYSWVMRPAAECNTKSIVFSLKQAPSFLSNVFGVLRYCFYSHMDRISWSLTLCSLCASWQGCPIDQVRDVLSRVPMAQKFAKYWICQVRLMEQEGNLDVLPTFEEAVRVVREVCVYFTPRSFILVNSYTHVYLTVLVRTSRWCNSLCRQLLYTCI